MRVFTDRRRALSATLPLCVCRDAGKNAHKHTQRHIRKCGVSPGRKYSLLHTEHQAFQQTPWSSFFFFFIVSLSLQCCLAQIVSKLSSVTSTEGVDITRLPVCLLPHKVSPVLGITAGTLILLFVPEPKRGSADQMGGRINARTSWLCDMKALGKK